MPSLRPRQQNQRPEGSHSNADNRAWESFGFGTSEEYSFLFIEHFFEFFCYPVFIV